jgi:hypothetical protein
MSELTLEELATITIRKLDPEPGEILLITLGGDLGDGLGHWIPTADELIQTAEDIQAVVPEGVKVLVHHHLANATIISLEEGDTVEVRDAESH